MGTLAVVTTSGVGLGTEGEVQWDMGKAESEDAVAVAPVNRTHPSPGHSSHATVGPSPPTDTSVHVTSTTHAQTAEKKPTRPSTPPHLNGSPDPHRPVLSSPPSDRDTVEAEHRPTEEEEDTLELAYDETLGCFYDPVTGKHYVIDEDED
ncbi:hypothetical protein HK104_005284 [Borealophlyctis nickersoniae]|nr:hypothetical protein HK104_005284 [Borealophlyctis nickersoniae]